MPIDLHYEQAESDFEENKEKQIKAIEDKDRMSPEEAAQKWQDEYDDPIDYHTCNDD